MVNQDEQALRRFVAARDAGDGDAVRAAAKELVELLHDRIEAVVALEARRQQIPRDERDDVVQDVHVSVLRFLQSLRGSSMGELHNAIKLIAHHRCVDHIRARVRQRRDADDLDGAGWEPGEDGDRPHAGEVEAAWEEHERVEERFTASDFVAWALPQLDRRQRIVVERDMAGTDPEATCVELRVTRSNLYQLRRRANVRLQTLHQEYFS